jgi:hypothetical protein
MPPRRPKAPPGPKFMTPADVAEQVRRIGAWSMQDDAAFAMEYRLFQSVIASIAGGAPMARELCEAAIQSRIRWGFERWADE